MDKHNRRSLTGRLPHQAGPTGCAFLCGTRHNRARSGPLPRRPGPCHWAANSRRSASGPVAAARGHNGGSDSDPNVTVTTRPPPAWAMPAAGHRAVRPSAAHEIRVPGLRLLDSEARAARESADSLAATRTAGRVPLGRGPELRRGPPARPSRPARPPARPGRAAGPPAHHWRSWPAAGPTPDSGSRRRRREASRRGGGTAPDLTRRSRRPPPPRRDERDALRRLGPPIMICRRAVPTTRRVWGEPSSSCAP